MPPVSILIKPASSLCNLKCKYCFYADVSENRCVKSFGMMSEDTLEMLCKRVFEYAEKSATFSFQGGEPTLVGIGFYKKLIELQKKYNTSNIKINNTIQTNGYIIDDEWAVFLKENGFLVGLSLDGTADLHNSMRVDKNGKGAYNKALRAAELFRKHGVDFNILCVVNNFVAKNPIRVYSALKKYKYIQFIACLDGFDLKKREYSLTNERYSDFLVKVFNEYYKDFLSGNYVSVRNFDNYLSILMGMPAENCAMRGVCSCYFVVEGDGSVYPCDFYVLDEWKLGSVAENSFDEMIRSERAVSFVNGSKSKSEQCIKCRFYRICKGGCRREREREMTGDRELNRFCPSYYKLFEQCLDKMIDMAEKIIKINGSEM